MTASSPSSAATGYWPISAILSRTKIMPSHHQAGRDADANRERFRGARLEPRNSGDDIERCPHGSLGIIFVRERIAEIGQYPVAAELGEEAVIGSRDTGAGSVIGVDHSAHVLRIESRQHATPPHQITDPPTHVTAL